MISNITDTLWFYSPGLNICLRTLPSFGPGIAAAIGISELVFRVFKGNHHLLTLKTAFGIGLNVSLSVLTMCLAGETLMRSNGISPAQALTITKCGFCAVAATAHFCLRAERYLNAVQGPPIPVIFVPPAFNAKPSDASS